MLASATDNELLMLFVRRSDELAFRRLVERHAAVVMGVSRQVLGDEHLAEDAFQATFLILSERASRLLNVTSLAGWLHRVAFRTALRLAKRRKRSCETKIVEDPMVDHDTLQQISQRETQQALHDELQKLPVRYRDAIVLCDLEGTTRQQAAEKLDCTEASVKAALARGRRQLRMRLVRRGVALSVATATAASATGAAKASVSTALVEITVDACAVHATSCGTAAVCSETIQSLFQEGVRMMTYSSIAKPAAGIAAALMLIVTPIVVLAQIPSEVEEPAAAAALVTTSEDSTDDRTESKRPDCRRGQSEAGRSEA